MIAMIYSAPLSEDRVQIVIPMSSWPQHNFQDSFQNWNYQPFCILLSCSAVSNKENFWLVTANKLCHSWKTNAVRPCVAIPCQFLCWYTAKPFYNRLVITGTTFLPDDITKLTVLNLPTELKKIVDFCEDIDKVRDSLSWRSWSIIENKVEVCLTNPFLRISYFITSEYLPTLHLLLIFNPKKRKAR